MPLCLFSHILWRKVSFYWRKLEKHHSQVTSAVPFFSDSSVDLWTFILDDIRDNDILQCTYVFHVRMFTFDSVITLRMRKISPPAISFPPFQLYTASPQLETLTSVLKYCPEWLLKLQWAQWGFHAPPHPVMLIPYQQSFTALFSPSLLDKRLSHSSQCEQEMI